MNKNLLLFFSFLLATACSRQSSEKADSFIFGKGKELAELTNDTIGEASGLAASVNNSGLLWTINDSGNDANVFLIDTALHIRMTVTLANTGNRDWEDISIGPGPDSSKTYVYVGDIGDNLGRYEYKYIYRFEEPVLNETESEVLLSEFERITFRLPYERQDMETLMVDPLSREIYLVTKREKAVTVYALQNPVEVSRDTLIARYVGKLNITGIVAGDISMDGREILLKNIYNVYYWQRDSNAAVEDVLRNKPKILSYNREPQGEAITFAHDGSGYYTLSERVTGERSFLSFYKRN
jgi:hypothetical protein